MGSTHAYFPGDPLPYHYKYEHMAVTTDCVIFTYEDWKLKVLLVRRGGEPCKGMWAFPGGFLKNSENAGQGALRELREETSLEPSAPLVQLGVFSEPDRDPRERVITIAWYALVKPSQVAGGDDAEEAAWFPVDGLPPLALDHQQIFDAAMERLKRDIHFQPVGFDLLDDEFTLPDLQRLYEAILGTRFDRRNFQRKILASGILEEARDEVYSGPEICMLYETAVTEPATASQKRKGRPGRTGTFYRLNRMKYEQMKEDGDKLEF
ncbi:MAG: NUDIX hydrolase [Bacteroidales bacterium]|nr:NUDIX hydrolase [Bacteroidales bacterium]